MDFELRRAREKLEREQKERKDKARLKVEKERKAKAEAIKQREAVEAVQRSRRLDAIEAELKAEQQMQESLLVGGGIVFDHVLAAAPFEGYGDKIKLPPSCFVELSDKGAFDKGPLYFQLSVEVPGSSSSKEDRKTTHSGVLEFTAEEGSIGLPPQVWNNLFSTGAPTSPWVEIRYVRLPKGTYAKLQPDGIGFSDLPNHKAILETILRQHATLSQDEILTVNYGTLTYKLRVLGLKPATSVSVLETDIEVDIVHPDVGSEGSNQNVVIKPLSFKTPESGVIEEGKYMYYKFSIDDGVAERIASGDIRVEVKIDVEKDGGDTDLYVSRHPILFPTRHQHQWSSHDVGSKSLILGSVEKSLSAGTYSIGVYGFKGTTKYDIYVDVQEFVDQKLGQQASTVSPMEVDTLECRNCKHFIPSRSIALHEAYCSRHNVVCQHPGCGIVLRVEDAKSHVHCHKCGQSFQQNEIEKHMQVFHEPLTCGCGVVFEKEQMVQHQSSSCPLRLIVCRFCGDMVPAGNPASDARDRLRGLSEHESQCGSRTAPCDSCGNSVMLKDMDIHQIAVHQKS